jgi:hypothetical protein
LRTVAAELRKNLTERGVNVDRFDEIVVLLSEAAFPEKTFRKKQSVAPFVWACERPTGQTAIFPRNAKEKREKKKEKKREKKKEKVKKEKGKEKEEEEKEKEEKNASARILCCSTAIIPRRSNSSNS